MIKRGWKFKDCHGKTEVRVIRMYKKDWDYIAMTRGRKTMARYFKDLLEEKKLKYKVGKENYNVM